MNDRDAKFFVYFAKMPDGLVKIGTSSNLTRRMAVLKAELVHFIEGSSFREAAIHYLMRPSHEAGEFFRYTKEVAGFIADLKAGNYGPLIDEVPRVYDAHSYGNACAGKNVGRYRCFRIARDSLGLSVADVANDSGVSEASVKFADSAVAPMLLSGRLVQCIVCKAAERGIHLGSFHFTGLYDDDLRSRLSALYESEEAA